MEALFLKLLNLSMTAGWLVLVVLVLRVIFRKAPRWIFCLLWGLVALRLIFPFSLESALSLIPSAEPIPADIVYQAAPTIDSGIPVIDHVVNPVISESFAPEPVASVNPLQVVSFIASWIWLLGLATMVIYSVVSFVLLKRRVRTATILRDNIRQCETVDSPFVLGFFRPTIYLPYSISEDNINHVIAHEQAHIHRGDHWWKPLGFLLLAVYWFNPLIWVAYILFCRDMELACDEKVVANMEQDDRRAYSTALLNCSIRRRSIAACPLAFGEVGVKDRVKCVMNYKKPAFWIILIALLACIAAAVCFLTVPKDDLPHTLEVTGLPAPKGGADPYADLEPAERAAAFLMNADNISYEFYIMMYGEYITAAMEYEPYTVQVPNSDFVNTFDHSDQILNALYTIDLASLRPMTADEIQAFDIQVSDTGLIHVGDARCRASVWLNRANQTTVVLGETYTAALVFTFTDGTVCAFEEAVPAGEVGANSAALLNAISIAGAQRAYALHGTGGNVMVTQLSTGQTGETSAYGAAYITSVFENTPHLAPKADEENGQFDYQVILENGSVYLFDEENLLLKTEAGHIYPIGGFEKSGTSFTAEQLLCNFLTHSFQETTE